jgi:hypothetical protein
MMSDNTMSTCRPLASAPSAASAPVTVGHREAERLQQLARERRHFAIVLHEQHVTVSLGRSARDDVAGRLDLPDRLAQRTRQEQSYRGADADGALDRHPAPRLLGESIDLRQTEPRSFVDILGREERLEGTRLHVRWHADAGVRHGDSDEVGRATLSVAFDAFARSRARW